MTRNALQQYREQQYQNKQDRLAADATAHLRAIATETTSDAKLKHLEAYHRLQDRATALRRRYAKTLAALMLLIIPIIMIAGCTPRY